MQHADLAFHGRLIAVPRCLTLDLIRDRTQQEELKMNIGKLALPDSADRIVEEIYNLAKL